MSISSDNATEKTINAFVNAERLAREHHSVQLSPLHLALALWEERDGLLRQIINRCSGDAQEFERSLKRAITKLPQQDPPPETITPSRHMFSAIQAAQDAQRKNGDSHLAIDHLVLSLARSQELEPVWRD